MSKKSAYGSGIANDASSRVKPTLAACLEVVLGQSNNLISAVLDGLENSQGSGAGLATRALQQPMVLAALGGVLDQRKEFKRTFAEKLRHYLYAGLGGDGRIEGGVSFEELSFTMDEELDENIEIARAQEEVNALVSKNLPAVDALVSTLMGWMTVQSQLNPLRPEVFVRALRDAFAEYVADQEVRGQLITPAAGKMGVVLDKLYKKLTDWLRTNGVEAAGSPTEGSGGEAAITPSVQKTMLTLDKLKRLITGDENSGGKTENAASAAGNLVKRGSGFMHTVPLSVNVLEDMSLMDQMLEQLTDEAKNDPDALRRRQEEAKKAIMSGKNVSGVLGEEVTRVMLENLTQDERLLPKLRALLRRLEPALLGLSQTDTRFFSNKDHPARQFLDEVTDRCVGFKSEADAGFASFYDSVHDAVKLINQQYKQGSREQSMADVFWEAIVQLLGIWERTDALLEQQREQAARALLIAEQRNERAMILGAEYREMIDGTTVPEEVKSFLVGVWAQVVAKAQLTSSRGDTRGYGELVADLIWSVQPEKARKNRDKLVNVIPTMLTKLRLGLRSVDYPMERVKTVFDVLLAQHEAALEGRKNKKEHLYDVSVAPDDSSFGQSTFDSVYGAGDSRWEANIQVTDSSDKAFAEVRPSSFIDMLQEESSTMGLHSNQMRATATAVNSAAKKTDSDSPQEDDALADSPLQALQLKVGAWLELLLDDEWMRVQLSWESPRKTMFVFISRNGQAHSLARKTLEKMLAKGKVRMISEGKVLDKAFDVVAQTALRNSAEVRKH